MARHRRFFNVSLNENYSDKMCPYWLGHLGVYFTVMNVIELYYLSQRQTRKIHTSIARHPADL